jgi:hypothetical protein
MATGVFWRVVNCSTIRGDPKPGSMTRHSLDRGRDTNSVFSWKGRVTNMATSNGKSDRMLDENA